MRNDEFRRNQLMTKPEQPAARLFGLQHQHEFGHLTFVIDSTFVIRNSSFPPQTAFSPISSVRIRTACSTGRTNTLPSPILPVFAALTTTLTAFSIKSSAITTSTFTFGRKSTVYSLPR